SAQLSQLQRSADWVVDDAPVSAFIQDVDKIVQGPIARNYSNASGLVGVCLVDSGIDETQYPINFVGGYDFVEGDNDPQDQGGHGTLMANAITTIAPGAQLYVAKVLNSSNQGLSSTVLQGIDWCMTQNVSIISLSLGAGRYSSYCDESILGQK